jgi:hypothetical protein
MPSIEWLFQNYYTSIFKKVDKLHQNSRRLPTYATDVHPSPESESKDHDRRFQRLLQYHEINITATLLQHAEEEGMKGLGQGKTEG